MKVLVYAHRLEHGGSQGNAVALALELRDRHGFDVVIHAAEGSALDFVRQTGLRFVPAPDVRNFPSLARMRALRNLVRVEKPDLIHAWDCWQGLEAYYATHLVQRVPLLISDMMMKLTRALPRDVPTTFGFDGMTIEAAHKGWQKVMTLVPTIDTVANAPQVADGQAYRSTIGARANDVVVVSVARLASTAKTDHLARAIAAVRALGKALPLKLVIIGEGAARSHLQTLADDANRHLYREAVILAGEIADPQAAYDAADIVLGMGESALRGLAFGKPLIVVGEKGYAVPFTPATAATFSETGFYGIGDGTQSNRMMEDALRPIAQRPQLRAQLGPFGRDYVVQHHSLERVGTQLADFCQAAVSMPKTVRSDVIDAARTTYYCIRERQFIAVPGDPVVTP